MLKDGGAYKMIHEERALFWEVMESAIVREVYTTMYLILNSYETELFEFPDLTPLDFCLWGWMKSEVYKIKVDARQNCSLAFRMLLPAYRNLKINSDEKQAIFGQELRSVLGLTMRFAKMYCEL
jgi:hypothetical protein